MPTYLKFSTIVCKSAVLLGHKTKNNMKGLLKSSPQVLPILLP